MISDGYVTQDEFEEFIRPILPLLEMLKKILVNKKKCVRATMSLNTLHNFLLIKFLIHFLVTDLIYMQNY